MELTYSHVDILVNDLDTAVSYYERILGFTAGELQIWDRDGFHVRYKVLSNEHQKFMLVQPISGNLKDMLDSKGEGTIYRFCFKTPDITGAYRELVAQGVQPVNENGKPIGEDEMASPSGTRILWLPKQFGDLSIEFLEDTDASN